MDCADVIMLSQSPSAREVPNALKIAYAQHLPQLLSILSAMAFRFKGQKCGHVARCVGMDALAEALEAAQDPSHQSDGPNETFRTVVEFLASLCDVEAASPQLFSDSFCLRHALRKRPHQCTPAVLMAKGAASGYPSSSPKCAQRPCGPTNSSLQPPPPGFPPRKEQRFKMQPSTLFLRGAS
jgi:hypothetical protein